MRWLVYSSCDRDTICHYGVKGMKWGVRKEYVPHPRKKGKAPKWENENLKWDPVETTSEKTKSKGKETNKRKVNVKKIAKYAAIAAVLTAVGYLTYKEYQKISSGDDTSITKRALSLIRDRKVSDISSSSSIDSINKKATDGIKKVGDLKKAKGSQTKESVADRTINLAKKAEELGQTKDSQTREADPELNELANKLKDLGFPVVKTGVERADAMKSILSTSHPGSANFKSASASKGFFLKNAWDKELWKSLTTNERDGIVEYTGLSYTSINSLLRFNKSYYTDPEKRKHVRDTVSSITSALSKSKTKQDFIVHRGVKSLDLPSMFGMDMDDLDDPQALAGLIGKRFIDKGFVSTAASSDKAWNGVKLHINVPKGTQGMYVDTISAYKGENEFLLQRGSTFMIENLVFGKKGEIKDIILNVVSQDPEKS